MSVGLPLCLSEPRAFSWERQGDFSKNSGDGSWVEFRWETKVARLLATQDSWESPPTQPSSSSRRHEHTPSTCSRKGQSKARNPVSAPPMSEARGDWVPGRRLTGGVAGTRPGAEEAANLKIPTARRTAHCWRQRHGDNPNVGCLGRCIAVTNGRARRRCKARFVPNSAFVSFWCERVPWSQMSKSTGPSELTSPAAIFQLLPAQCCSSQCNPRVSAKPEMDATDAQLAS